MMIILTSGGEGGNNIDLTMVVVVGRGGNFYPYP